MHSGRHWLNNGTRSINIGNHEVREFQLIFRIDKFYLLARRYVAASFRFLKNQAWKSDVIEEYNSMLSEGPLQYIPLCHQFLICSAPPIQKSQIQYDII
jgi:hypothetical protein